MIMVGGFKGNIWAGESKATMGFYFDERADEMQRKALENIFTGKAGGFNVGALNMQTEDVELQAGNVQPGNNFTALRASRELPNRSSLGAMFVNRNATGRYAGIDNWNRTFGLDGKLGVGERITVAGFAARRQFAE